LLLLLAIVSFGCALTLKRVSHSYGVMEILLPSLLAALAGFLTIYAFRRRLHTTAICIGIGLACALGIAIMYGCLVATCDIGMRPFLAGMSLVGFPFVMIGQPLGLGVLITGAFGLSYAFDTLLSHRAKLITVIVCALFVLAITPFLSTAVTHALGGHPVPGNCVI
jgi:hypothetical protein